MLTRNPYALASLPYLLQGRGYGRYVWVEGDVKADGYVLLLSLSYSRLLLIFIVAEHRGVTNNWLVKLQWAEGKQTTRHTTRFQDLRLCSQESRIRYREELVGLLYNPERFIARVLCSGEKEWVARLDSLISNRDSEP